MWPVKLREELIKSFTRFERDGICVLCRTPLSVFQDDFPCPHWLLTPGRRAFSPAALLRVFECFDVEMVADYLSIASHSPAPGQRLAVTQGCYAVRWRTRDWFFSRADSPGSPAYVLAIRRRGQLIAEVNIPAPQPDAARRA